MRDCITLFINGQLHHVHGDAAMVTVGDFLRRRLGLTGTKLVCSEGDCGACTVLVGRSDGKGLRYKAINACITFMCQLHGAHLVTIEGLASEQELTHLQQSFIDHHGSQCGFCTPGFLMATAGLMASGNSPEARPLQAAEFRSGLTGNLCRCTGYQQIIDAACSANPIDAEYLRQRYDEQVIIAALNEVDDNPVRIRDGRRECYMPVDIE